MDNRMPHKPHVPQMPHSCPVNETSPDLAQLRHDLKQRLDSLKRGLYDPSFEHDNCGIGMLVDIKGRASHQLVTDAISILEALTHRGGVGFEPDTGDGAGILIQMPDALMRRVAAAGGIALPDGDGSYGVAMLFASPDAARLGKSIEAFCGIVAEEGLEVLGVRTVPVSPDCIGRTAAAVRPSIRQVFIGMPQGTALSPAAFERALYLVAKQAHNRIRNQEHNADPYFYLASCSSKTIVYKGMLLPSQLADFYLDLKDRDLTSAIALVHSRFSTNTFPSWERAHPMHHIVHNGEINTIRGNVNWVRAREVPMRSSAFGASLTRALPVINEDGSDSAMLDDFLNLMIHAGWPLHEAVMLAIPEPWEEDARMPEDVRAMYEYNSCLVEPWDGPASVAFTDGRFAGATLDRNGLRPSRYYITSDDQLILASEVGVLPLPVEKIVRKDRLRPGRMLLIDTFEGRIIEDDELKAKAAQAWPFRSWLDGGLVRLKDLVADKGGTAADWRNLKEALEATGQRLSPALLDAFEFLAAPAGPQEALPGHLTMQKAFGYTWEDLTLTLKPIAERAEDPIASMGYDAPPAVLSRRPQLLYNYFKQLFAQVTNPPIDAIREHLITSSSVHLGSEGNLLAPDGSNCRLVTHHTPILNSDEFEALRALSEDGLRSITVPMHFDPHRAAGLEEALEHLLALADAACAQGYNILIVSDEGIQEDRAPIPALLAVAGLHHHLVRRGMRTQMSIVAASAEPREVHHLALLVGYGANAVYPYLAYESIRRLADEGILAVDAATGCANYQKAVTNSIVKVMSKMGISTVRSYHGAQVFEALGIAPEVIDRYFTGTVSRIGGLSLAHIGHETRQRHLAAFEPTLNESTVESGGEYKWRNDGEYHLVNPESVYYLQQAVRRGDYELFRKFSACINDRSRQLKNLRALLDIVTAEKPIPLESVEPAESIVRRFKTGAMSFGSISQEAHECMAVAMNRLGGKSNSGEGGEAPERYLASVEGEDRCSAVKQVASGRFGVTIDYLNHASEIQIKMAQGAKPGEGGHLPGRKVYPWVAKNRFSTPGVEL
ncbi:MAG: glutamate synthase subunit alpha, partial [Coriobacteriales bacterium]|nr:glutamate synthase subunit alpha [Coriobacteriales bacterium]